MSWGGLSSHPATATVPSTLVRWGPAASTSSASQPPNITLIWTAPTTSQRTPFRIAGTQQLKPLLMMSWYATTILSWFITKLWSYGTTHTLIRRDPRLTKSSKNPSRSFPNLVPCVWRMWLASTTVSRRLAWDIAWRSCRLMLWSSRTASRDYVPLAWVSFDMLP